MSPAPLYAPRAEYIVNLGVGPRSPGPEPAAAPA